MPKKRTAPFVETRVEFEYSDGRGGKVVVDADGLRQLLREAFQAGLVRFSLHMPKSGKCVTSRHSVTDWEVIECLSKNAWLEEYADDPTVYIDVDVEKDAINGGLWKEDE
jgi:hypothetical protein